MALRKLLLILSLFIMVDCFGQSPMFKLIAKRQSSCSYLLDQYSGAAAAYSLRKLDCDYAGSAIRVRRSSDNTESDIGFTSGGDLDTAALKTFVGTGGSDDGFVTTMYNQNGSSSHATQTTAANQPIIVDNGVILRVNSLPAIYYADVTDILFSDHLSGKSRLDIYFITSTSDITYIHFSDYVLNGAQFIYAVSQGSSSTSISNSAGTPSLYVNSSLFSGTTRGDLYTSLNGSKIVTIQNMSTTAASNWGGKFAFIGYNDGSNAFKYIGYLSELIAWDSDVSANRSNIISNINTYYSIY